MALARERRFDDAVGAFEDFLRREPNHDQAWIAYAQMSKKRYMQQGAPALAYEACGSVLDRGIVANAASGQLWQARGLLELQQGKAVEAKKLLEKAVALDESLAPVLRWKAVREVDEQ
ncbi:hypothetical protein GPECTOR_122g453 [Gonium pectorale]|uniref:Tetratricopeptide repeat protein n=1 Tax=Gonium pectorale TaxID=33097 RepID=A0A150FYM6_GONPE|nr:hypothetical protein GPECTOR_122g453 [Gonium pectorale]|eukprot:KXZ42712.1 hypothetical protein GPECTOR_122g453 [Gonium pectorale]